MTDTTADRLIDMGTEKAGIASIFIAAGAAFLANCSFPAAASKVINAIIHCRTPVMGCLVFLCNACGERHVIYKSCRNRHCPQCQGAAARRWMEALAAAVLPAPYFHIVFTLPEPIAAIVLQNRKQVLNILFRAATTTLKTIAADPRRTETPVSHPTMTFHDIP